MEAFEQAVLSDDGHYPPRVRFIPLDPANPRPDIGAVVLEALFEEGGRNTVILVSPEGHELRLSMVYQNALARVVGKLLRVTRVRVEYCPPRSETGDGKRFVTPSSVRDLAFA